MNIALHTSAYSDHPLEHALSCVSEAGYRFVEIAADLTESRHFEAHCASPGDVTRLDRQLRDQTLSLVAVDIGGWDPELCIANLDEVSRRTTVENVGHALTVADDLGCHLVTAHLWGLPSEGSRDRPDAFREPFLRSIAELSGTLDRSRVNLNLMPHPGGFIETSNPTVDLIREAAHPQVGYTFGTSHAFVIAQGSQTAEEMIRYAGETLTHVLISDTHHVERIIAPPEVKAHEHTVPGSGDVDFSSIVATLLDIDYDGVLCVHLISERDRIDRAARRTKDLIEEWIDA